MADERHFVDFPRLRSLIEKFRDKSYRDSYIAGHTRRFLARQMRKFRGDLSQSQFGDFLGKRQTVVSRLEDPKYGKWTLQTLFDVAAKLNVAVIVRFVDIPTFIRLSEDMSDEASRPSSYDEAAIDAFVEPKKITINPFRPDEPAPVFDFRDENKISEIFNPSANKQKEPRLTVLHNESGGSILQ